MTGSPHDVGGDALPDAPRQTLSMTDTTMEASWSGIDDDGHVTGLSSTDIYGFQEAGRRAGRAPTGCPPMFLSSYTLGVGLRGGNRRVHESWTGCCRGSLGTNAVEKEMVVECDTRQDGYCSISGVWRCVPMP